MYDVAIIGGGPAAIFAAYEFVMKYPELKLVMLEAGNAIDKRFCPLAAKKVDHCINCKPCSIMRGFGGAGAFSDGKYNFTTEWDKFGKRAGYIRNEEMAQYADACVCFWDYQSKGTKHMINLAKAYSLKLRVVKY